MTFKEAVFKLKDTYGMKTLEDSFRCHSILSDLIGSDLKEKRINECFYNISYSYDLIDIFQRLGLEGGRKFMEEKYPTFKNDFTPREFVDSINPIAELVCPSEFEAYEKSHVRHEAKPVQGLSTKPKKTPVPTPNHHVKPQASPKNKPQVKPVPAKALVQPQRQPQVQMNQNKKKKPNRLMFINDVAIKTDGIGVEISYSNSPSVRMKLKGQNKTKKVFYTIDHGKLTIDVPKDYSFETLKVMLPKKPIYSVSIDAKDGETKLGNVRNPIDTNEFNFKGEYCANFMNLRTRHLNMTLDESSSTIILKDLSGSRRNININQMYGKSTIKLENGMTAEKVVKTGIFKKTRTFEDFTTDNIKIQLEKGEVRFEY